MMNEPAQGIMGSVGWAMWAWWEARVLEARLQWRGDYSLLEHFNCALVNVQELL